MKIKKIITCGCSFSEAEQPTWPYQLETFITGKFIVPEHEKPRVFEHLGAHGQGQELIQKKAMLALTDSLKEYEPEEIAVIVMWSGTTRKSFYIDNTRIINRIIRSWNDPNSMGITRQFADLKNKLSDKITLKRPRGDIEYGVDGGWYITRDGIEDDVSLDYFELVQTPYYHIHVSAENMIMLQNSCKANNVKFYQQYFMDFSYTDLEFGKEQQMIGYLVDQLDESTILSKQGMYEYLKDCSDKLAESGQAEHDHTYFLSAGDNHPNEKGHKKWVDDVIIPQLKEKGLFNE
jgi:hypothetical protein